MATHATPTDETTTTKPDAFERIVPAQLAETLRSASAPAAATARPLIIDVRGDDYNAGHIASAVNHPEPGFHDDAHVDALVHKYRGEETIVFHCQLSQVRGPFCARRFLERLDALLPDADKKPSVQVLTGGYAGFSEQFQGDAELLETSSSGATKEDDDAAN